MNKTLVVGAVVALILAAAYYSYRKGWLNHLLPAKWQHHTKSGFVGAYGRTPEMQGCIIYDESGTWPIFNRCTWS